MLKHSTYFEGRVQGIEFESNGRRQIVGVVDTGEFHFPTEASERNTVLSGELVVRLDGSSEWKSYPQGTAFEVPASSGLIVRARSPAAYLCELLGNG